MLFQGHPTPLPVPIPSIDQVDRIPGDVLLTFTDRVPQEGLLAIVVVLVWAVAMGTYGYWRIFKARPLPDPDQAI